MKAPFYEFSMDFIVLGLLVKLIKGLNFKLTYGQYHYGFNCTWTSSQFQPSD